MNHLSTNLLRTLVTASPQAALIVDRSSQIVCANTVAKELLRLSSDQKCAANLFNDPKRFDELIQFAARSTGLIPAVLLRCGDAECLRINVQPLAQSSGCAADVFLLTLEARTEANSKVLALKHKLEAMDTRYREVLADNKALKHKVESTLPRLRALSYEDALTGAKNRRFFDRQYEREWRRSVRRSSPLTLLCIDIDHFKAYNDSFGHPEGDRCIKAVCEALKMSTTREFDEVCRTGGEEFIALLPMTDTAGGILVAHRALAAVRRLGLEHPAGGVVTVSVGVGTCTPHAQYNQFDFLARVDRALYRAKASGRDCLATLSQLLYGSSTDAVTSTLEIDPRKHGAVNAGPGVWATNS